MSKTTKWYKTGDEIPDSAVYIKTEHKKTGEHLEGMGSFSETIYEYTEMHLYEIPWVVAEMERKIEEHRKKV